MAGMWNNIYKLEYPKHAQTPLYAQNGMMSFPSVPKLTVVCTVAALRRLPAVVAAVATAVSAAAASAVVAAAVARRVRTKRQEEKQRHELQQQQQQQQQLLQMQQRRRPYSLKQKHQRPLGLFGKKKCPLVPPATTSLSKQH